ncbi:hypothetical protein NHQ30_003801 [Ciborinia camelliae]|nr:hypothetical protein NHQ30_003801 [Ciborinia camelliae]
MKFSAILFASLAIYASVSATPMAKHGHKGQKSAGGFATTAVAAAATTGAMTAMGSTAASGSTIVMKEVGGIPGNECLTFRNNGEIVDAACVDTSADRQVTPTAINGLSVLLVQRTFTADFRPDLVNAQACIGFNGTDYLAQDCAGAGFQAVTLVNNQLKSGTSCQSGHDGKAQLTVDTNGASCASVTTTDVTPAPS